MALFTRRNSFSRVLNLKRYQKIVTVFVRHGFGSFVEHLELEKRVPLPPRLLKTETISHHSTAEHLRLAFQELGPTFVKLGQIISTRPDLLGPDFVEELSKLQDSVPPDSWEDVRGVLVDELGSDFDQIFESIEPQPLAAASLAQVHLANLKSGDEVVVKIQRPNILKVIDTDLEILKDLASLAQRTTWGEVYNPVEMVEEFSYTLHNELDYRREGRNAERFRANFSDEEYLYIPKIYWEYTTRRVLIMERLQGTKVDDISALDLAGCDRKQVAMNAGRIIVKEVLQDGFFHADPHAGNFVVMSGKVIGAMDFGMVGELTERDRKRLIQLYINAVTFDVESLVDELVRMNAVRISVDRTRLSRDLDRLLNRFAGRSLKEIRSQEVIDELIKLSSRHHLTIPANLWLLGKTLVMMEGVGLRLDPDFDIFAVSKPYVDHLKRQIWLPNREWGETLLRKGSDWAGLVDQLPRTGRHILEKFDRDELFLIGLKDLDRILNGLGRLVNRLSFSIMIAGLVISLATILSVTATGSPLYILLVVGFLATFGLAIWLLISILRGT